jgi:hypothetical protein
MDPAAGDRFPLRDGSFVSQPVPTRAAEVTSPGLPLDARRAADIHVKVPAAPSFVSDGGLPAHRPLSLKSVLEGVGFYEILSEAGNYMYSAHFSALPDADDTFAHLVDFVRQAGGASGVSREVCTAVWRKQTTVAGASTWAEIPPHLTRVSSVEQRAEHV